MADRYGTATLLAEPRAVDSFYWITHKALYSHFLPYASKCRGHGSFAPMHALLEDTQCNLVAPSHTVPVDTYNPSQARGREMFRWFVCFFVRPLVCLFVLKPGYMSQKYHFDSLDASSPNKCRRKQRK